MNKRNAETHIPDHLLMLYLDGELPKRKASAVARHLAYCWSCRARSEQFRRVVFDFVELRNNATEDGFPADEMRRRLRRRLDAESAADASSPKFLSDLVPKRRNTMWYASGLTAAMASLLVVVMLTGPPAITAAEFLRHVQETPVQLAPHTVAVQRVRVRQGGRSVEREVVRGAKRSAVLPVPTELRTTLGTVAVDWDDPLDAASFVRWHALQTGVSDRLVEAPESITLVASPREGAPVRSASLMVRRADWRPIAKRFEFANQPPLEISELHYEVSPLPAAPSVVADNTTAVPPASPITVLAPAPSDAELARAEITARETLHALDADRLEAPSIVVQRREVEIRAITESEQRRNALVAALTGIPHVRTDIRTLDSLSSIDRPTTVMGDSVELYASDPPWARELWRLMGGMDEANQYLELVRSEYGRTHAMAIVLRRLAQRYDEYAWNALPGDVRVRVNDLAGEIGASLEAKGREYLTLTGTSVNRLPGQPSVSSSKAGPVSCVDWRALNLAADLEQAQSAFRQMFLVEQLPEPMTESAGELLSRHRQWRQQLNRDLEALCAQGRNR